MRANSPKGTLSGFFPTIIVEDTFGAEVDRSLGRVGGP